MIKNFYRPSTVEEALEFHAKGGVFLAGGTEINRGRMESPDLPGIPGSGPDVDAVYLEDLGLKGVRTEGDSIYIGACTTLQEVIDTSETPDWFKKAAGFIPSRNIRNMATVGGNIAACHPHSGLLPVLLAAGAFLRMPSGGVMSLEQYLGSGRKGLILEVEIPPMKGICRTVKESRSHLAVPVVTAGAYMETSGNNISVLRIGAGCGCAGPIPGRLKGIESKLTGTPLLPRDELISLIEGAVKPPSDIRGSAEYRARINGVKIADLLIECREALS